MTLRTFRIPPRVVHPSMPIAGLYLNKIDVADLAGKLRNSGMSEYADRIEKAYNGGTRLFHISTPQLTAFFVAVD